MFPVGNSFAAEDRIVIRGLATDASTVSNVWVNGVPITLTRETGSSSQAISRHPASAPASATHGAMNSDAGDTVSWSAEVALEPGQNSITVAVEGESGGLVEHADTVEVRYVGVPSNFSFDEINGRIIGLWSLFTPFSVSLQLLEHDLATGTQRFFDTPFNVGLASCVRGETSEFLYLINESLQSDDLGAYALRRFDLDSSANVEVTKLPDEALDPGDGFERVLFNVELLCSSLHEAAYLHVNFIEENEHQIVRSRIVEVDLGTTEVTVLSDTSDGFDFEGPGMEPGDTLPPWVAGALALSTNSIFSVRNLNSFGPLTRIDLGDGSRHHFMPETMVQGIGLAAMPDEKRVYIGTFDGVYEIDLHEAPPSVVNISPVDDDDLFFLPQIRSMAVDTENARLIIGDSDREQLIAVDLDDGERSVLLSRNLDGSFPLLAPRRFAVTADVSKAYIADDGGNAAQRLFEVDLKTGARRELADINQPFNVIVSGIALDEDAGLIFIGFENTIIEVGIESNVVQSIADTNAPESLLQSVSDLALDKENNRLLVADAAGGALVEVSLANGEQAIVSKAGTRGEGSTFSGVNSLTRVPGASSVFVSNQAGMNVMRVDLDSGDRTIVLDQCMSGGSNVLGIHEMLQQVHYDPRSDAVVIIGDNILSYDIASEQCHVLLNFLVEPILQVQLTARGQMFATTFRSLVQLDLDGDPGYVVISQ